MYQILKNKLIRRRTEYIIVMQAKNTVETRFRYMNPIFTRSTFKYSWGHWQSYYMEDLKRPTLPCHYFVELLDKDYVVYQGLSEEHPSYFIDELVSAGVIKSEYKHAILICIAENYNIDIPEYRMYEHLASKCICSLMRRYKLRRDRIKYFDEVLTDNWDEMLATSDLTYDIEKTTLFDPVIMFQHIGFYKHS